MFSFQTKPKSSKYAPITAHDDGEGSKKDSSSSEDDHSAPLLEDSDNAATYTPPPPTSQLPKIIIYLSFALALLSAINVAILPSTLSKYRAFPLSDSELQNLPYGDARLGLDRAAKHIPPPLVYHRSWPDRIARVSRKLKSAVYGNGVQVYITVEDSTIMRFPVPSQGSNACAISWRPPPDLSARVKDLTTKGDITEIEVWQVIAPSATSGVPGSSTSSTSMHVENIDYDAISYATLPVRGELLGVLDLTAKPNSTTVEFACPSEAESLVVELRCQRVACHVSFKQVDMLPRFGFELVRRAA